MRFLRRRRPTADEEPAGDAAPDDQQKGLLSSTRAELRDVRKRYIIIASLGIMGVAFAGVLLFSAFSLWWTSQASFCNRCHIMNKYVATWEASKHGDVNCENCHINPGLFNFVGGKIAGLQVVANYLTGNYNDNSYSAAVSNSACLRCHESLLNQEHNTFGTLMVSHRHIVENGGKCMDCHSTVAHTDAVPVGAANYPTMDKCMRCHDGVIAPTTCTLCHASGPPEPTQQDEAVLTPSPTPTPRGS